MLTILRENLSKSVQTLSLKIKCPTHTTRKEVPRTALPVENVKDLSSLFYVHHMKDECAEESKQNVYWTIIASFVIYIFLIWNLHFGPVVDKRKGRKRTPKKRRNSAVLEPHKG